MKTVTIVIGNSDDKLTQQEWSDFVKYTNLIIGEWIKNIHFFGFSNPDKPWQNCCWLVEIENDKILSLKKELSIIRANYKQDSIAWIEGDTKFI